MKTLACFPLILVVALGAGLFGTSQAQSPLPNVAPKITLKWLLGLSVNPASVPAGKEITATLKLLRPAINPVPVGLTLSGAQPIEGGILAADGAVMLSGVTVPAGSDRVTFEIWTVKGTTWTGTRTFTVGARYGSESVSTTFTVTR